MVFKGKVQFDEGPPDNFDPEHPYADPVAFLEQREYLVREKLVKIERAKILKEKLRKCYQVEGVNHLQNCKALVKKYLESIQDVGWGKEMRIFRGE